MTDRSEQVCCVCGQPIHDTTGYTDGGVIGDRHGDYWFCAKHHAAVLKWATR